jgi:hypothetical protein
MATKFNSTMLQLFDSFATDFIAIPLSYVFSAICLPVSAMTVKQAINEVSIIDSTISK